MLGPLHSLLQQILTRELRNVIHTDERSVVSVADGNVRLENVRLRCDVLERMLSQHLGVGLPGKIVLAHCALVSISIPWGDWSRGYTEVTIDGLAVLLASHTCLPDAEEVRLQKEKLVCHLMERIVTAHQQQHQPHQVSGGLVHTLLRNLLAHCRPRFHLSRVHVRYEHLRGLAIDGAASPTVGVSLRACDLVHADDGFGALVSEIALQLTDAAAYVHLRSVLLSRPLLAMAGRPAAAVAAEERRVVCRMHEMASADDGGGDGLGGRKATLLAPLSLSANGFLNLGCFFGTDGAFALPILSATVAAEREARLTCDAEQAAGLLEIGAWLANHPLRELYALHRPAYSSDASDNVPSSGASTASATALGSHGRWRGLWRAAATAVRLRLLRRRRMDAVLASKAQYVLLYRKVLEHAEPRYAELTDDEAEAMARYAERAARAVRHLSEPDRAALRQIEASTPEAVLARWRLLSLRQQRREAAAARELAEASQPRTPLGKWARGLFRPGQPRYSPFGSLTEGEATELASRISRASLGGGGGASRGDDDGGGGMDGVSEGGGGATAPELRADPLADAPPTYAALVLTLSVERLEVRLPDAVVVAASAAHARLRLGPSRGLALHCTLGALEASTPDQLYPPAGDDEGALSLDARLRLHSIDTQPAEPDEPPLLRCAGDVTSAPADALLGGPPPMPQKVARGGSSATNLLQVLFSDLSRQGSSSARIAEPAGTGGGPEARARERRETLLAQMLRRRSSVGRADGPRGGGEPALRLQLSMPARADGRGVPSIESSLRQLDASLSHESWGRLLAFLAPLETTAAHALGLLGPGGEGAHAAHGWSMLYLPDLLIDLCELPTLLLRLGTTLTSLRVKMRAEFAGVALHLAESLAEAPSADSPCAARLVTIRLPPLGIELSQPPASRLRLRVQGDAVLDAAAKRALLTARHSLRESIVGAPPSSRLARWQLGKLKVAAANAAAAAAVALVAELGPEMPDAGSERTSTADVTPVRDAVLSHGATDLPHSNDWRVHFVAAAVRVLHFFCCLDAGDGTHLVLNKFT